VDTNYEIKKFKSRILLIRAKSVLDIGSEQNP